MPSVNAKIEKTKRKNSLLSTLGSGVQGNMGSFMSAG